MANEQEYITIVNMCCCCGGDVKSSYEKGNDVGRAYAEATDVCIECFKANCSVMNGTICNVTKKKQARLVNGK